MSNGKFNLVEIQSIEHSKSPVTCTSKTTIKEAAQIMQDQHVGSILIVNDEFYPIGIITDRDLRNKVVTGDFGIEESVSKIMSCPVITIQPNLTVADVQIMMMKYNIHHLVLTKNGQPDSKVIGVISEHDLLVIQGNNPAVIIRELHRSQNGEDLGKIRAKAEKLLEQYLLQEVSINFISSMMTEVNDALINKAIELGLDQMELENWKKPEVNWCWLALGSEGREEQLLRTDQDNALVFGDVPKEEYETVKSYFLELAKKITFLLHQSGFEYCPGEMMASNPKWCKSLSEWEKQFSNWILEPTEQHILYCSIFFDYRPVFGDFSLADALTTHIFQSIESHSRFLTFLALNVLQSPKIVNFFQRFILEKEGAHKKMFDIKGRAMMPLTDAARILILNAKEPNITNTFHRFEHLAALEPQNRALFQQAADAYETLVRYRALSGLRNKDSGRYIDPSVLSRMERLNLRNSFRPHRELQDLLKVRFQLNLFI